MNDVPFFKALTLALSLRERGLDLSAPIVIPILFRHSRTGGNLVKKIIFYIHHPIPIILFFSKY